MNTNEYNKLYYISHPELKFKAKERERQKREKIRLVSSIFDKVSFPFSVLFNSLLFIMLMSTLTFLLLQEMAAFYLESDGSNLIAWLKAGSLEVAIILFSFSTHKKLFLRIMYKTIAIGICALSMYAVCSKQLNIGLSAIEQKQINSRAITDIEKAIDDKSMQKNYLLSRGMVTAAGKVEVSIDTFRSKLGDLRAYTTSVKPITVLINSTAIQILTRVFIILANIFSAYRLREISRSFKKYFEISRRKIEIKRNFKVSRDENQQQEKKAAWNWKWFTKLQKENILYFNSTLML